MGNSLIRRIGLANGQVVVLLVPYGATLDSSFGTLLRVSRGSFSAPNWGLVFGRFLGPLLGLFKGS